MTNRKLTKINTYHGTVSLHLAIVFSLLMTLIFYTIESCHLSALACRADGVSYMASDSLFAHYCLPIFEKYGLFVLNEQGINMDILITSYAEENCDFSSNPFYMLQSFLGLSLDDIEITDVHYITDDDAADFVAQVCEQVKYLELTNLAEELLDTADTDSPEVFTQDSSGVPDINFDNVDASSYAKYASENLTSGGDTDEDLSDIDADSFVSSISSTIGHFIENSLLSCIVENPSTVSSLSIDKTTLPSVTCDLTIDGVNASYGYYKDESEATYEKACFCEYITYTFGNYVNPSEESALKYQTEYILSGSSDDDTNLINTALQLIALRTGFNMIHLLTDESKYNAAWKISQAASSIPLAPYIIQATILTVWATAESIIDVRDLLSGKPVPLIKNDEQWSLSLQGLKRFSKNSSSVNDGKSGLTYERYLEMLLVFQNNISTYYRTLDLIQMDICKEYSKDFRISACVTGIDATYTYSLPSLLSSGSTSYEKKYIHKYY